MIRTAQPQTFIGQRRRRPAPTSVLGWVFLFGALLFASGCGTLRRSVSRPGLTRLSSPLVILPAERYGSYLVVKAQWDRNGPYRFLVDTGSSVTLVSPQLADRYGVRTNQPPATPEVRVRSASGEITLLDSTTIRRIELGEARFDDVPALIYDCEPISSHLGVAIDGILGFPLFRQTLLTLDYPRSQILLARNGSSSELRPGATIPFNNPYKTPVIPVHLGDVTFAALIDSGSDSALSLNPVGLDLSYAVSPHPGGIVSTLTGDHSQTIGRLANTLELGEYRVLRPVVQVSDELSAIGGRLLQNFTVTFDQQNNDVTFYRDSTAPLTIGPRRSAGLSFTKSPVYWRVASVIPGSPAATTSVRNGDLVIRINGEPVAQWNLQRYESLVASASEITYTLLEGSTEQNLVLSTYDLVP